MTLRKRHARGGAGSLICALLGSACSSTASSDSQVIGAGGGSGSGMPSGEGAGASPSGEPVDDGLGSGDGFGSGLDVTPDRNDPEDVTEDTACGKFAVQADKIVVTETEIIVEEIKGIGPAALYIMQDQSGSMIDKWFYALDAITQFVNDPSSSGIDVAMQYFPITAPLCIPLDPIGDCNGTIYTTPEVPFATLETPGAGHNQAVITNFTAHGPCGAGTPIEGAIRGAIAGCKAYEQNHPDVACYGVIVTDGAPSLGCAQDAATLSGIAAAAAADIQLFTVGMPGTDFALMDAVAQASGTDCNGAATPGLTCNASNAAEFAAALAAIRERVTEVIETTVEHEIEKTVPLDCEWEVPKSDGDTPVDLSAVNVEVTDVGSGAVTELGKVASAAECPDFRNGWHYDNPTSPSRIVACGEVCNVIKAIEAKVDILVGCESKPATVF